LTNKKFSPFDEADVEEPGTGKSIFVSSFASKKLSESKKILYTSFNKTEKEYFELSGLNLIQRTSNL